MIILRKIEYYLRIIETLKDAFGNRLFGFAMMSIVPGLYMIQLGIERGHLISEIKFCLIYNLFWLFIIRLTLNKREKNG